MTTDLNKSCAEANKRVENWISKSAGQHRRAMKAQIVQTHAEAEYAKPNHGYVDLDQRNSDRSSPHVETRDAVEVVTDFTLVVVVLFTLIFVIFALLGYWSRA
jgi:hypothetical protein